MKDIRRIVWDYYSYKKELEDEEGEDEGFDFEDKAGPSFLKIPNDVVLTPMGRIQTSGWNPLIDKNQYVANTNFDVTELDAHAISSCPGVEGVNFISRYSFAVIVGDLFSEEDVIERINLILKVTDYDNVSNIDKDSPLYSVIRPALDRLSAHKHWLLYVLPNGEYIERAYDNEESLQNDVEKFTGKDGTKNIEDFSNCIVFTSKK